ncbi:DUF3307 domain-containing protein [Candidatus Viridilinea mediisalina]|uniref:DUF3307 domain-containing protein n=1 Tax=Candidatus Viridilinea mediisalina TaxID=2024553 RepID=A0A2A6RK47_9CHLR|nr:DUF3307 domain-containing protein [Candidatus Viridilinea mediisalina]PDW03323.1 hypothetical protein CJ255_09415 [Candidatus Viridilinea mediisalina]
MFYLFLLAHMIADFALQPLWLVRRKRYWYGLVIHIGLVLVCMLALGLLEPAARALWPAMLAIGAIHFLADWWKVNYGDGLFKQPLVPYLLDQVIHIGTLVLVLSLVVPPAQLWSPDAVAYGWLAIYLNAYMLAALAVPITLIVLFDPSFRHAAQAAHARARSLLAAVVVLSLSLLAGPLALPVTLAGLAWALRRPASQHPLDTPSGIMAVVFVAATTGALLAGLR